MGQRNKRRDLKTMTTRAMIGHAFFRLESALTVALVIILAFFYREPFHWWKWWYWLMLGIIGEALIVLTSLTDLRTGQRVVADMLRQEFDPREINIPEYRQKLEKALDYRERIETAIATRDASLLQNHLKETTLGISDWIENIFLLAKRLDRYQKDPVIQGDTSSIPKTLAKYEARLALEDDPAVKAQILEAISSKRAQLDNLKQLENTMERAEFQLEATLAALGTVYSQLLLIGAKDIDGVRPRQISQKIRDQVDQLQDVLDTMDEVYRES